MSKVASSFFNVSDFSQQKEKFKGEWIEGEYKKDE